MPALHALAIGVAMIWLATVPAGVQAKDPELPSPETVVQHFLDVTLGASSRARIVKWDRTPTIRLEVFDAVYDADNPIPRRIAVETPVIFRDTVESVADQLSALIGHNVRVLPSDLREGGDIVVSVLPLRLIGQLTFPGVSASLLRKLRGPGRCFFLIWPERSGLIKKAHVVINKQLSINGISHCFYEEIIQSFGLPHDSEKIGVSLFNDAHRLQTIPSLDRLLIELLYDPSVRAGMNAEQAQPIIAEIAKRRLSRGHGATAP